MYVKNIQLAVSYTFLYTLSMRITKQVKEKIARLLKIGFAPGRIRAKFALNPSTINKIRQEVDSTPEFRRTMDRWRGYKLGDDQLSFAWDQPLEALVPGLFPPKAETPAPTRLTYKQPVSESTEIIKDLNKNSLSLTGDESVDEIKDIMSLRILDFVREITESMSQDDICDATLKDKTNAIKTLIQAAKELTKKDPLQEALEDSDLSLVDILLSTIPIRKKDKLHGIEDAEVC